MYTELTQAIDPELTEEEQRQLDKMVDTDLEVWKEDNGRSREMVQTLELID